MTNQANNETLKMQPDHIDENEMLPENSTDNADTHEPQADSSQPDEAAARIAALEAELAATKDTMLRIAAEADNTRKRAERMQLDAGKYAIAGFARDLLDVSDNLNRALTALSDEDRSNPALASFAEGVAATERVMSATLEKHGLRRIAPESGAFDPNIHEVMFEADIPGKPQGEIIQLLEMGYMLHERLLRPARVGVAKGDSNAPTPHSVDETA